LRKKPFNILTKISPIFSNFFCTSAAPFRIAPAAFTARHSRNSRTRFGKHRTFIGQELQICNRTRQQTAPFSAGSCISRLFFAHILHILPHSLKSTAQSAAVSSILDPVRAKPLHNMQR
jgi:hypothetical protein